MTSTEPDLWTCNVCRVESRTPLAYLELQVPYDHTLHQAVVCSECWETPTILAKLFDEGVLS